MMESDLVKGMVDLNEEGPMLKPSRPPAHWTPSQVARMYSVGELERMDRQLKRERHLITEGLKKHRRAEDRTP